MGLCGIKIDFGDNLSDYDNCGTLK